MSVLLCREKCRRDALLGRFVPLCTVRLVATCWHWTHPGRYPLGSSVSCWHKLKCSQQGLVVLRLSPWVMAAHVITQCNYWIANDLPRLFVEPLYSTNSSFYKWGSVPVTINQSICCSLYFSIFNLHPQSDKAIVITDLFLLFEVAVVKRTSNDLAFRTLQNFSQVSQEKPAGQHTARHGLSPAVVCNNIPVSVEGLPNYYYS